MKRTALALLFSAFGALAISSPMAAHHGTAVYDSKNLTTLKGNQ